MRLAFVDTETTGLAQDLTNPDLSKVPWLLEVGIVVVDTPTFNIVAETNIVLPFKRGRGTTIHPKVEAMHTVNGLWTECEAVFRAQGPQDSVRYVSEQRLIQFLHQHDAVGSQMAGANPDFDRQFLRHYMPKLEREFHYRNFDINSMWLLQSYIAGLDSKRAKPASHRALDDCRDAIKVVEQHFDFMVELCKS